MELKAFVKNPVNLFNIIGAGALLPFFILSFYNIPTGDDYWSAVEVSRYGVMGATVQFYQQVSPRFMALWIMNVLNTLPSGSIWIFKFWPMAYLTGLFFSYRRLLRIIITGALRPSELTLLSLLMVMAHLSACRSLYEGLYWMSATVCYGLAILCFLNLLASAIRYTRDPGPGSYGQMLIWGVCMVGCSELTFLFLVIIYAAVLLQYRRLNRGVLPFIGLCLALLACFSVLFFTPAVQLRTAGSLRFEVANGLGVFALSLKTVGYYLVMWGLNPVILCTVLAFGARLRSLDTLRIAPEVRSPALVWVLALTLIVLGGGLLYWPLYFSGAVLPFPRVTTLFFVYLVAAALGMLLWGRQVPGLLTRYVPLFGRRLSVTFLYFLVITFFIISPQVRLVTREWVSGEARGYDREWRQRLQDIQQASGDTCYVRPLTHWSRVLSGQQREADLANPFIHLDDFFQKALVRLPPTPNPQGE